MLILAVQWATGQSYVIDSLCVGSERTYRVDGEKGSTYQWFIRDTLGNTIDSLTYTDFFREIAPGDTTWGAEAKYVWDSIGIFDVSVLQYSVHGCDTIEQGRVKVFDLPFAYAGWDIDLCGKTIITIVRDSAANYREVRWTTSGDGTFDSDRRIHVVYSLGPGDSISGSVILTLTAYGLAANNTCTPAVDEMRIRYSNPKVTFDVDNLLCYNDSTGSVTAITSGGIAPYHYEWRGPGGFFATGETITGLHAGWYTVEVTDDLMCTVTDSVEVTEPPQLFAEILTSGTAVCENDTIQLTANATGGTGLFTAMWTGDGAPFLDNVNGNTPRFAGAPAGVYTLLLTVTDENGCTATDTETITVHPSYNDTITLAVCRNDFPYDWNGTTIYAPGTFTRGFFTVFGCDSVVTLELYMPVYHDSIVAEVCENELPFVWNGNPINLPGFHSDTLLTAAGCDSIVTVELFIWPVPRDTVDLTACANELPLIWQGRALNLPGVYSDTLTTIHGCDSILTANFYVWPVYNDTTQVTACENDLPYFWHGESLTVPGFYSDSLLTVNGCDSVITVQFDVLPMYRDSSEFTVCENELPYDWNGQLLSTPGFYSDTLKTIFACDSILTLELKTWPVFNDTAVVAVCRNDFPYNWNGNLLTSDGFYTDTLATIHGCDSIVNLELFMPVFRDSSEITVCENFLPYDWNGNLLSTPGFHSDTLLTVNGCDSIVVFELKTWPMYRDSLQHEICANQLPYDWHGLQLTTPGFYADTLLTIHGCDSIINLEFIVWPVYNDTLQVTVCENEMPYNWNGDLLATPGFYADSLLTIHGCDSIVTLQLDTWPVYRDTMPAAVCENELPFSWHGQQLTLPGFYSDTLTSVNGCDSIQIVDFTIWPVYNDSSQVEVCRTYLPYNWNGQLLSVPGFYSDTLTTINGCDSVLVLELIVPVYRDSSQVLVCENDLPYPWQSQSLMAAGFYSDTLLTAGGCDSIVTLHLLIDPALPVSVRIFENMNDICVGEVVTFSANPTNGGANPVYAWYVNGGLVSGVTGDRYSYAPVDGDEIYAILTSSLTCTKGNPATSNKIIMSIFDELPVSVSIVATQTDICDGQPVTFTATPVNGGIDPVYAWFVNGVEVAGETKVKYTYNPKDNDEIYAVLTSSLGCATGNPATSNKITIHVAVDLPVAVSIVVDKNPVCSGEPVTFTATPVNGGINPVYAWYVNNVPVPGETAALFTYTPANNDVVHVMLSSDLSCAVGTPATSNKITMRVDSDLPVSVTIVADKTTVVEGETVTFTATPVNGGATPVYAWFVNNIEQPGETLETFSYVPQNGDEVYAVLTSSLSCVINNPATSNKIRIRVILPTDLFVTAVIVPVDCYGNSTGSVLLTVTGGSGVFDYAWKHGPTTKNLLNVPEGTYIVTVTDSNNGNTVTDTFTVTQPEELLLSEKHKNDDLGPDPTGSIDITVTGGTAPYSFVWSNGATTEDLTDLAAGVYTVTVTDKNNCEATTVVTIIHETVVYSISCPDTLKVLCYEDLPANPYFADYAEFTAAGGAASSGCGINESTFAFAGEEVVDGPYCLNLRRTYQVLDSCGNTLECVHVVVVNDAVAPVMSCAPNILGVVGDVPAPYLNYAEFVAAGGSATDNCGIIEATFHFVSDVSDGKVNPTTITRTYEIADYCGNVAICRQIIEVSFNPGLSLSCPPPITVSCPEDIPAAYITLAAFVAAGGSAYSDPPYTVLPGSFTLESEVSNGKTCPQIITRTYSIENSNGDKDFCSQQIIIHDLEAPTLIFTERDVECGNGPFYYDNIQQLYDSRRARFDDNCGWRKLDIELVAESSTGICPTVIRRTYRLTDDCGNSVTRTEVTTVSDTKKPVIFTHAPDIDRPDCILPPPYRNYDEYRAAGGFVFDCNDFVMAWKKDSVDATGMVHRFYLFTDICGNDSLHIQKITRTGIQVPVFNPMGPFCLNTVAPALPSVSENGISGTWNPRTIRTNVLGKTKYTFTPVNGECAVTTTIEIEIIPGITPEFDPVGPFCFNSPAPVLPLVSKNGVRGSWSPAVINTTLVGTTAYTFYPDPYQCAEPVTLNIRVTPEIVITGVTINTGPANRPTGLINITVAGGTAPFSYLWSNGATTEDISKLVAGVYSVTVTDAMNCVAMKTFTITSEEAKMTMLCPANINLGCVDEVVAHPPFSNLSEYIAGGGNVISNCGIDTASFQLISDDTITGVYCLNIMRSYTITDSCGMKDTCTQFVFVNDTELPVLVCPADTIAECLPAVLASIKTIEDFVAAGGVVSDNCRLDTASFTVDKLITPLANGKRIVTTFSIKDWCGNEISCTQTMISADTIAPVASCASIEVYLGDSGVYRPDETDIRIITAGSTDNCTLPENLTFELIPSEVYCTDVESGVDILVIVKDEAGNVDSCTAHINVVDNLPPVAICRNDTIYIDENGHASVTTAQLNKASWDNCAIDTMYLSRYDFDCADVGVNKVTLTVIDKYNLRDSCVALVTVLDTLGPYVTCRDSVVIQLDENAQYTIQVNELYESSYDVCGIDTLFVEPRELDCDHIGKTVIKLWAVDVHGDSAYCESLVTIHGNIAPTVVDDSARTAQNIPVLIDIVSNDFDEKTSIDISTLGIVIKPLYGVAEIDSVTGDVLYTPNPNYSGVDVLQYKICDDGIPCDPECGKAFVYIVIEPTNIPPVAVDDYFSNSDCQPISNNVMINDHDESGDPIFNPVLLDSVDHGQITVYADGSFDYVPNEGFVGIDSFRYEISDVGIPSLRDTAWVYIDVYCTEENENPLECELFVPEGFSPNGDGIHDFFRVMCIHLYPNATMRIFNRNGNLLWMKEHYGNIDYWGSHQEAWWWGNTEYRWDQGTRAVPNQPGKIVKVSNYVWVLDLGNGEIKNGTVMVQY